MSIANALGLTNEQFLKLIENWKEKENNDFKTIQENKRAGEKNRGTFGGNTKLQIQGRK